MTVIILVLAYLIGSIPSGLIIGKLFYGIDIREHGSKNLGGTNTFRTLGKKAGFAVTIMDVLKGTLATLLPLLLGTETHQLLPGVFAVIGHMYPVFAGFKGGKAVATSGGIVLAYAYPLFLIVFVAFFVGLYLTKYVSLSSIIASVIGWTYTVIFHFDDPYLVAVMTVLASFIIYRHRANIERIRTKTEPKITWLG